MTPSAHYAMCLFAERATGIPEIDSARVRLIQVARGFGKSLLVTKGLALQQLLRHNDYSIGLANETQRMADKFLGMIKLEFETNDLLRALWPERLIDPRKTTWSASEIVIARKKPRATSPSVLAVGAGGTVTGTHTDHWIIDDMISREAAENALRGSFTEIESMNRWLSQIEPLLCSPKRDLITIIGCIAHDEPVLMADGTRKPIQDVRVGDEVWACKKDGSEGFAARKVTGVWPQGEAKVVEVRVAGRTLRCTPDHPLLASAGRADGVGRRFEPAGELTCKVEAFEDMQQADENTEELAWLLGFLFGDGWITRYQRKSGSISYSVGFALGADEVLNERVITSLGSRYGITPKRDTKGCARLDCNAAGRELESLGLLPGVGAREKRLPAWLYAASRDTKRAFLHGFCDADGAQTSPKRWAVELANGPLIEDLHHLALTCGVRPTSITQRTRTTQPPNSPSPVTNTFYHIGLNFVDRNAPTRKYKPSVSECAVEVPVYDLSIEDGDCAFVASGIPVGNTPWYEGDTYAYCEEFWGHGEPKETFTWTLKLPTGEIQTIELVRIGELAIFRRPAREHGRSIFPERWTDEELDMIQIGDPVFFAANYLLEPSAGGASEFDPAWLGHYQFEGEQIRYRNQAGKLEYTTHRELVNFISVDPAISDSHDAARSAVVCAGTNGTDIFLLEDFAERGLGMFDLAHRVADSYMRYRPRYVFVEAIAYQRAFKEALAQVARERGCPEMMGAVQEIKSHAGKSKDFRIYGLEPYFKRRTFHVHSSHRNFLYEYGAFPRAKLRDVLDALSFQKDAWERMAANTGPGRNDIAARDAAAMERMRRSLGRGGGY